MRSALRARRLDRIVLGATVAVLALPVLVDLLASGRKRVHAYLAADAFYYLQVARNVVSNGRLSFDGNHATNGFHPLWQAVMVAEQAGASVLGIDHTPMLYLSVTTGLVFLVGLVLLLAGSLRLAYGRLSPLFVLLPVGMYALLLAPVWIWVGGLSEAGVNPFEGPMPLYGTLWSYANGMETSLVLLCFALALWTVVRRRLDTASAGARVGAALALMVLARLDTALVAAGVMVMFGAAAWFRRDRGLAIAVRAALLVLGAVMLVYLAVNRAYAGAWLPVSGTLKSTFPSASLGNWRDLQEFWEHPDFLGPLRLYRLFPEVVPTLFAIVFLAFARVGRIVGVREWTARDRCRLFLVGTALGVVAIAAYNFFYVPNYNQGHWYYPVNTLFVMLVVLDWTSRIEFSSTSVVPVVTVIVVVGLVTFVTLGRRADYHARIADFWFDGAPALRAAYGDGNVPPAIELDDGVDVVALRSQGLSGIGLMLDHAAIHDFEHDRILDLALQRGIDRIVSLNYFDATGLGLNTASDEIRSRVEELLRRPGARPPDLSEYEFSIERAIRPGVLRSPWKGNDGSYVVIRFRRR